VFRARLGGPTHFLQRTATFAFASAATPQSYTYTDGAHFYVAVATNTCIRRPLSSFSGVASGVPVPTASYYPGFQGMETFDSGYWYLCTGANSWGRAALTTF
jgi:hypothetical protein